MAEGTERKGSRIWTSVRLLLVLAVFLLLARGVEVTRAWAAASPRFAVVPERAAFAAPAPWLLPADLEEIRRDTGLLGRRFSFFDPDLVRAFREGYRRSPWVERVVRVRPRYPNRVDVLLEVKKPVAGVLIDGRRIYLVDGEGRRLPGVREEPPDGLGHVLLRLDGVVAPVPYPGDVWSAAVREGVSVAAILALRPELVRSARIVAVDVSNVGLRRDRGDSEILLVTESGARVEWGRSELSRWAVNEYPVAHKLDLLETALRGFPGLQGLERVRVQFRHPSYFRRE